MHKYKQSNRYTCSSAAMLVILNHFRPEVKLTKENEFSIWCKSATLPVRAPNIYALAALAQRHKINAKVYVGELDFNYPNYRFKSYKLKDVEDAKFTSKLYFQKAKDLGVKIFKKKFDMNLVKDLLNEKKVVLLRLNYGLLKEKKAASNYLPVFGYSNGKFLVIDTIAGEKKLIPEELMQESFETLKTKCHRDNRMIVLG